MSAAGSATVTQNLLGWKSGFSFRASAIQNTDRQPPTLLRQPSPYLCWYVINSATATQFVKFFLISFQLHHQLLI